MQEKNNETGLEIAVIGMAGRFPCAKNIQEYWDNLKTGKESISFFSDEELEELGFDTQIIASPGFVRAKGVLAEIEYFSPDFFNFTPGEAEIMDPQLRIFLECSWHALEDAGCNPDTYDGAIGIYAGNAINHYWIMKIMFSKKYHLLGAFKANLLNSQFSTQVSYHLNLKGPSLTILTACSTSLTAIHTACLGLLSSESDIALAGGVSLDLPQKSGYLYQEGMIGSPDGHCRAFDARAKGTVSGSGAGVVVLKKLEDAIADGNYIYAVIKGTAINNDGLRKVGYTAPSVEGQAEAIRNAYIMAEVDPKTVSCIETHGTGTPLGDPVEIEALSMVFKQNKKNSIPIGSVKTNLGHLDSAAGAAGFIKTVLALKYKQIPPTIHFENSNPKIPFENTPFYVNRELKTWENNGNPLRAGVSSFGLGGTNVHVVLEEWPGDRRQSQGRGEVPSPSRDYQLILLSAQTPTALDKMTENLTEYFKKNLLNRGNQKNPLNPAPTMEDAVYTLQMGRKPFQYRKMILCPANDAEKAVELLSQKGKSKAVKTFYRKVEDPPVIFLLPGQGSQYVNMGRDLYQKEPLFRQDMDRCFEILTPLTGYDLKEILYPADTGAESANTSHTSYMSYNSLINQTEITQPLLFAFEYALAKLLMKWGITPGAMIGYSMGEYIAACLSGVFSLEDALKLVTARGQLMRQTPAGAMLSIPLPEEEIKPLLENNKDIWLAIVNGPSCIAAGTPAAVEIFENQMKEKRLMCAPLNLAHAVHTPLMDPVRREFGNRVKEVKLSPPQIPYISNVSGRWITEEAAADPGYWAAHLCNTARFSDGVKELLKLENAVFIEIGPGRLLSNIVRQHLPPQEGKKPGQRIVNIVKHQQEKVSDDYFILSKLGELWLYGIPINWTELYRQEKPCLIPLPPYPFEGKRYWIDENPFKKGIELPTWSRVTQNPEVPGPEPSTRQLPKISPDEYEEEEEYEGPRDELEQDIARVWQEFLGYDRIGIYDDFFEINGDSLTATQLITRLQHIYPVEISLQRFFEKPTIANLAQIIKELLVEKVKNLSEEELERLGE
jgi:acyl transferase domain-containing protein